MQLVLRVDGAPREALERGVVAAQIVLNNCHLTAAEASLARWARGEWLRNTSTDVWPPEGIAKAAAAFALAEAAAINACCAGRPVPDDSRLEVAQG
jgi:hypothetical protein